MTSIKILEDFEALREEFRLQGITPAVNQTDDICYTLPWFENLAATGLSANQKDEANCKLLFINDSTTGHLVCLPLLAGKNLSSLSNYYSSLYGPLNLAPATATAEASESRANLWKAVARHLRQAPARWPTINLSPLDQQAPYFSQMLAGLKYAGYWADSYFCFGNWYLEVANRPFAAYFAGLPPPLRNNIERGQRRLTKNGTWHIHVQKSANSMLEAAIFDFLSVYSQSWKEPEPNALFIPGLIQMAAKQGWLRLGILRLGNQAVAAQLWLVKAGKAYIYKLAYVQGFERFSSGSVLTSALMEYVIDVDNVQEVDYLVGDEAYKCDWMSHRRERRGLIAFNPQTTEGLWRAGQHFLSCQLKKWKAT